MAAIMILGGGIVAYAMYITKTNNKNKIKNMTQANIPKHVLDPYQPYLYQTIADIIFSPQLAANEMVYVPRQYTDGIYGMTQENFNMNANEPITQVHRSDNLIH